MPDVNAFIDANVSQQVTQTFSNSELLGKATEIIRNNSLGIDEIKRILESFSSVLELAKLSPLLIILLIIEVWALKHFILQPTIGKFLPSWILYIVSFWVILAVVFIITLGIIISFFGG